MLIALVTWRGLPELAADDRLLRDALVRRGVDARAVVWDDEAADWSAFDAIVIRSTWDYHKRFDEFRAWLDRMEGLPLWNPAAVLKWNTHKSYLLDLQSRGIAIVPTLFVPRGSSYIVKPAVSATAFRTERHQADSDLLVQPFVPEIVSDGELSFIFLGRKFSHAVRKRAGSGDFRVQTEFGGSAEPFSPPQHLIDQAADIADTLGEQWLYARVDCVVRDGRLLLMELEATEPSLFLDGQSAERFADAITSLA
jgi:glutathione synthase/RimK-type ligase-like ATP-grasp enzyme